MERRSSSAVLNRRQTSCTLYQDIFIPPGATSLTLKFDPAAKAGNATVPNLGIATIAGSRTTVCTSTPEAALTTYTAVTNVTAVAGTTVRLAFLNGSNNTGHEVVGIDNVPFEGRLGYLQW